MKRADRLDRALLLNTAITIARILQRRAEDTSLRVRIPEHVSEVNTGGWRARIGSLGFKQPKMQIWLDYFAGHNERKFNFCFYDEGRSRLRKLAEGAPMQKPICRYVTEKDMKHDGFYVLKKRLMRKEFDTPVFEQYWGRWCFFGIYDTSARMGGNEVNGRLCERAAAFFESVARGMPTAKPENEALDVYPQEENRQKVVSHLQRERSRFLAIKCKQRDDYRCQVCGMRFDEIYGAELGEEFSESHHRVPLSRLKPGIKTEVDDLATVCANCHRMLHRMKGKYGDVEELRRIFRRKNK